METSLLGQTKVLLALHRGKWRQIADDTGLDYSWLTKVGQGQIKSPGVVKLERLYNHLRTLSPNTPPPTSDSTNRRTVPNRRTTERRQEPTRRAEEATPGRRTGGERRQGERRAAKAAEDPPKPKEADRAA